MLDTTEDAVAKAIEEIQVLVSADGARLDVLESVEENQLRFQLDLSEVGCADCLLPVERLAEIATASLQMHTGNPQSSVVIVDPRETS